MQLLRQVRPWQLMIATLAAWLAVHFLVIPHNFRATSGALLAFTSAAAIILTLIARRQPRSSEIAFAGALALIGLGNASSGPDRPFPSITDLFYLVGTALLAVGVARRYIARREVRPEVLLEAVIVTAAGTLLVWELVIDQIFLVLGFDVLPTLVAVAYPIVDVLLIGVAVRIVVGSQHRDGAIWLTVAGCAAFVWSDIVVSTQLLGTGSAAVLGDIGWVASYGLLAAGAVHPGSGRRPQLREPTEAGSRPRVLLLLAAAMLAPLLIIYELIVNHLGDVAVVAVTGVILSILVVTRLAVALRDLGHSIDQRERLRLELDHRANHDSLTGLANRSLFTKTLERALADTTTVAVLLIDLDDFQAVNDSIGSENGDQLLREVSRRIATATQATAFAARLGGDEFAVMLPSVTSQTAADVAADLLLGSLRVPFTLADRVVLVRASIGVAMSDSLTADELMRNAGIAMYLAKGQGKDRYQWFDVTLHDDVLTRMRVRADLEAAIGAREFVVHYQPIVDLATGRTTGTEALVRWQHRHRGLVAPAEFIEIAETTGLIVPLGRWVLNEALATTRRWQVELDRPDLGVAVNVSARQFEHAGFRDDVVAALAASGMAAQSLTLEITESVLVDTAATISILRELKALGVRIAVDDFGTGYSSLSYVGRLPIDVVKIDRAFVAALGSDSKEGALAESVIRLGHSMDLTTVAEGVEDARQLEMLRSLGCDLAQGFFLARPAAAHVIEQLIREPQGSAIVAPKGRHPVARQASRKAPGRLRPSSIPG
jgi:diguanylate cyclase (GGDEF)-like protein